MPWPIPCPNCRRFVPSDVVNCPHCGLLRPGERWRRRLTSWLTDDPRLLPRIIVWVSAAWFVLSLWTANGRTPYDRVSGTRVELARPTAHG